MCFQPPLLLRTQVLGVGLDLLERAEFSAALSERRVVTRRECSGGRVGDVVVQVLDEGSPLRAGRPRKERGGGLSVADRLDVALVGFLRDLLLGEVARVRVVVVTQRFSLMFTLGGGT